MHGFAHTAFMENQLLREPIGRLMMRLSLPAILGMVLFGVNQLVDAVFVGRLVGERALAGVSVTLPIAQLFLGLGAMVGGGAGALLSIALGRKDDAQQRQILPNMNLLTAIVGVLLSGVILILTAPLVRLMGGTGELLEPGTTYLRTIAFAAILQIWGLGGNFVIRAEGKLGLAMFFGSIGLITNLILNYFFIAQFGWGVAGAAWATNAGMAVYAICNTLYFTGKRPTFEPRSLRMSYDREVMGRIAALGMPSLIFQVMALLQQLTIYRLIAVHGGVADTAFFGAVFRIFFLVTLPMVGMQRALQPIVGQNFGAGQFDRVRSAVRYFLASMLGLGAVLWLAAFAAPEAVLSVILPARAFDPDDLFNFRLFISVTAILPIPFVALTYFPSIGNASLPAALALARQVVVFIPAAIMLAARMGLPGIYQSLFWTDVIVGIISGAVMVKSLRNLGRIDPAVSPTPG